jgi:hypothetical protein
MSRRVSLAAAVLVAVPAVCGAQDLVPSERYVLRFEYREFRPNLVGDISKGFDNVEGTLLDLEDDLAASDDRTFELKGTLRLGTKHKVRGSYTPLDFDGDVTAERTFRYGQSTYNRFSRVVTNIKGGFYTGEYEWDLVRGSRGFLGLLIGVKVPDIDVLLVAPTQGIREQDTLRAPIPSLGAATRVYLGKLSLEGEISGLSIGERGRLLEAETSLRLHLTDRLAAQGGYRLLSIRGEDEDGPDLIDIRLDGWTFGVEISL